MTQWFTPGAPFSVSRTEQAARRGILKSERRFTHALFRAGSCPPDTVPWSLFLRMQIYPAGRALRRLGFAPLAPKQIWNCDRGRSWETGLANSDEEASQPLGRTKGEPHREGSWLDQRSGMPRVSQHALQLQQRMNLGTPAAALSWCRPPPRKRNTHKPLNRAIWKDCTEDIFNWCLSYSQILESPSQALSGSHAHFKGDLIF